VKLVESYVVKNRKVFTQRDKIGWTQIPFEELKPGDYFWLYDDNIAVGAFIASSMPYKNKFGFYEIETQSPDFKDRKITQ